MMLKDAVVANFFNSSAFDELLIKVGKDDVVSFKNNNKWLTNHPADAIIFKHAEETWDKIKAAYRTTFKELVLGEIPKEEDLITTLKIVQARLYKVDWNI